MYRRLPYTAGCPSFDVYKSHAIFNQYMQVYVVQQESALHRNKLLV